MSLYAQIPKNNYPAQLQLPEQAGKKHLSSAICRIIFAFQKNSGRPEIPGSHNVGHHGHQRLSQSPRWFTRTEGQGTVVALAICLHKSPAVAHDDCSCYVSPYQLYVIKNKTQSHYDPPMIMPAELWHARIKLLLCHSNVHEITNWEGTQLFWAQLKSYSLWAIGISGLRSITPSTVSIAIMLVLQRSSAHIEIGTLEVGPQGRS